MHRLLSIGLACIACATLTLLGGCANPTGKEVARAGDEIMVCGRLFHTGGAPVVLWTDPGGYDAYRVERRFVPLDQADWKSPAAKASAGSGGPETPNRYGLRRAGLSPDQIEHVRGGTWDLATLRSVVDQFVFHYDVAGTSRQCFRVLQDVRGLSVHFMLDVDGTIYQTLDVKERAWHATICNDRSIGIEIANIGAYPLPLPEGGGGGKGSLSSPSQREKTGAASSSSSSSSSSSRPLLPPPLSTWYAFDALGPRVTLPAWMGDGGIRTPAFVARPARPEAIVGQIQGEQLVMFDLTPQQYDSLIKLTATLCTVFPDMPCDYPRRPDGTLLTSKLDDAALASYKGLLGHYHIQANKTDPGPAFDWDRVVLGARRLLKR